MNKTYKSEISFNNRQLIPFLTVISLVLGIFIGGISVWALGVFNDDSVDDSDDNFISTENGEYYDSEYIQQIIELLDQKYLGDFEDIDSKDITYGMVKGLISSLEDRYTVYLDPEEAKEYLDQSAGDFEGIGITLAFNGQYTYVESVLKENPAESAGVLPGDVILKVDGEDVADILPGLVAQKIRGEKGTEVKLTLFRSSDKVSEQTDEIELGIIRNTIKVDNISWEKIDDQTALIEIVQFNDASLKEFNDTWDKIVDEVKGEMPDLRNIVVDLRGNPGGYVFGVKYILEEFLEDDQVLMKERTKNKEEEVFKDNRKGEFEDEKLVVLVNEGSASASEIFAAAIQDNERGVVIGEKTVGKGVEQEVIELSDGSLFLLVFQQWLTPNGRNINEENPITPDIEIEYGTEHFKNNTDPQMDRALEELK